MDRRLDRLSDAVTRRRGGGDAEATAAAVAGAAARIADRLAGGAELRVTGRGVCAIDAAHVAVEFLHPVIVGKRAVPAMAVAADAVLEGPDDAVVLGLMVDEDPDVRRALGGRPGSRPLTVGLGPAPLAPAGDVAVALPGDDPLVARESLVTAYHLLWETVHEHLDGQVGGGGGDAGMGGLYPFLEGGGGVAGGAGLAEHVRRSTARKLVEVAELRASALDDHADALCAAAVDLGSAGTVWTFGNGGSCTDAQALAHLLGGRARDGGTFRARALPDDVASLTALANDVGFDVVFARMLRTLARPGDVAVGFSTSGSSANVLAGLEAARAMGLPTIGFAGYAGGEMTSRGAVDHAFVVASSSVHRIQEVQTTLAHVLVELAG